MDKTQKSRKKRITAYFAFVIVFFIAEILHGVGKIQTLSGEITKFLSAMILITLAVIWAVSVRYRTVQKSLREQLFFIALLIVFWMIIRLIKYSIVGNNEPQTAILWYLYYVPQCLIPPTMFLAALSIDRKNNKPLNPLWYLIYVPAVVIVLLILTNNLHYLAFSFTGEGYSEYRHEAVYYVAAAWILAVTAGSVTILFVKCSVSACRKRIWIPASCLILGITAIMVCFFTDSAFFKQPELISFTCIFTLESCIGIGIIPSNENYADYFRITELSTIISDDKNRVTYSSQKAPSVSAEQLRSALDGTVYLDEDTRFCSKKIHGGHVFWTENVGEINDINEKLQEVTERLSEENDLIVAENDLKEQKTKIGEQNRLYDKIYETVRPELKKTIDIVNSLDVDSPSFVGDMRRACVSATYIKRRSNLVMISENVEAVSADELAYSVKESVDYLTLCGIECTLVTTGSGEIPCAVAETMYDFFEYCIGFAMPSAEACIVRLAVNENGGYIRIVCDGSSGTIDDGWKKKEIGALHGTITVTKSENTTYSTFAFSKGGDL